ncbi:MAG: single-stranded DNA-binding protein [Veillonella sp.]|nr:single-stranded DNA-binding protein [Veillonella sp.]
MNKVVLKGIMAREPLTKEVGDNRVCNFTVKCTSEEEVNGETKEFTSYVNCVAWNELADQYINAMESEPVEVEGRVQTRSYEKNGEKRYVTEIKVTK